MNRRATARCLLALLLAGAAGPALAAEPTAFSEAEKLVFTSDHLKELKDDAQISYRFERRGELQPPLNDTATLKVGPAQAQGRLAQVRFLSGADRLDLPDVANAEGNPIILHFLERQVREMNRLTRGSMNYYRKRIRMTLVDGARIKAVRVKVNGRDVDATEIAFDPYLEDPARSRYENFARTRYVLTLSDHVPGRVVELRSELLGAGTGTPRLMLGETLRFERLR